ncbi:hypothetical protein [Natrinema versiforme]|uniref:Uncharacterized protein n=1 Tax=Natrinema versiforme JCM 10478 TaxID=1227496 RepID=L9Y4E0_9EURY|nr:hypothetical protein [Natrinema versiforme]ELY68935.1 hypothetical protein C489_06198 [Natrinema versiforme JCM 10478]
MYQTQSRPLATALRLALVLALVATVLGASAPAVAADGPTVDSEPSVASVQAENATTNSTDDSTPSQADRLRVTPVTNDEEYLSIETRASDESYNTTGPTATFELSEPVDAARVSQSQADVNVLGGGTVIQIEYADDAAGSNASLYTTELFFADGSTHAVDLYATETDVSVEAAKYTQYSDYIDYTLDQAEAAGYERTAAGARDYLENQEERAKLFDSLFTEQVMMFISVAFAAAQNFVTWILGIAVIAGLAIFLERKHGWILRLQQMAESRAELMREAVRQDYEERRNSAAKHPLEDISEIGINASRYWAESDVETVDDMIEIACKGIVKVDERGNIVYDEDGNAVFSHHGVDDLKDVDPLTTDQLRSQTWLSPLILEGRLAATTALSNIEAALLVAEKDYNRGNEVREARRTVSELNARLSGDRDYQHAETSSNAARPDRHTDIGGHAAGGD